MSNTFYAVEKNGEIVKGEYFENKHSAECYIYSDMLKELNSLTQETTEYTLHNIEADMRKFKIYVDYDIPWSHPSCRRSMSNSVEYKVIECKTK